MKTLRILLACLFIATAAMGQDFDRPSIPDAAYDAPSIIEKGRPVFVKGSSFGNVKTAGAADILEMLTASLTDAPGQSLVVISEKTDKLGQTHARVEQRFNGMPIVGTHMMVHSDGNGDVTLINGFFAETDALAKKASLSAKAAFSRALSLANIKGGQITTRPELTYVLDSDGSAFLAWSAKVSYEDKQGPQLDRVFADATGQRRVVRHPGHFYSKNRRTYNGNYGSSLPGSLSRSEGQGNVGNAAIDDAHNNAGLTYDYYKNVFGRDSYNNAGATLSSTAHHQQNYNNAFWNGSQMVYGDGDGSTFSYFSGSLDVVAHELTHAVTGSESGLIYQNESGALNEAFSDIFGVSATIYHDGGINGNTWLLGEEIYTPGTPGDALRYMDDPARAGDRDYYPDRYTGSNDNGGVHTNSGIANLAYVLLVQGGTHPRGKTSISVPAIGVDQAQKIFYRAQTNYLGPNSNFEACRNATANSASDLYGQAAADAVHKAWDAVGVPGGGGTDPGGDCGSGTTYTGSLSGTGAVQYQPNGTYYYAANGNHVGQLSGAGPDFDLYLWRWNGSWVSVSGSESPTSTEAISYNGAAGYYTWRVYSYSGSGSYTLCIDHP